MDLNQLLAYEQVFTLTYLKDLTRFGNITYPNCLKKKSFHVHCAIYLLCTRVCFYYIVTKIYNRDCLLNKSIFSQELDKLVYSCST